MGILKNITEEYFGEIERDEDKLLMPETLPKGVELHEFKDKNGRIHKNGFYIKSKDKYTLMDLIDTLIELRGKSCDLNDIDVSNFEDFCQLFYLCQNGCDFNGDISGWDVSNVNDMSQMFSSTVFNGDISKWNVCNVKYMEAMFQDSEFDGNISKWNVKSVKSMEDMFKYSEFSGNNGSLENWGKKWKNKPYMNKNMFCDCPYEYNLPTWFEYDDDDDDDDE